jgi:hypothetical protein
VPNLGNEPDFSGLPADDGIGEEDMEEALVLGDEMVLDDVVAEGPPEGLPVVQGTTTGEIPAYTGEALPVLKGGLVDPDDR